MEQVLLREGQWAWGLLPLFATEALQAGVLGVSKCPLLSLRNLEMGLSRAPSLLAGLF